MKKRDSVGGRRKRKKGGGSRRKFARGRTGSKIRDYRLAVPGHRFELFLITWSRSHVTWFASSSINVQPVSVYIDRTITSKTSTKPWPINRIANCVGKTVNFASSAIIRLVRRETEWRYKYVSLSGSTSSDLFGKIVALLEINFTWYGRRIE